MKIRKYNSKDLVEVANLVRRTYGKFNGGEGDKKAAKMYLDKYSITKDNLNYLEESFQKSTIFFVVLENKKIIAMIRGNKNKIANLFVEGAEHGKGIGKRLTERFEIEAKKLHSREIRIKASL